MPLLKGFDTAMVGVMNSFSDEHFASDKIFTFNNKDGGAISAQLQNLGYSPSVLAASDSQFLVTGKGHGNITCSLNIANIPPDVLLAITGLVKDSNGIRTIGIDTVAPYCALILISHDINNQKIYMALLKGMFTFPERNPQTNTGGAETTQTDTITLTAVDRSDGKAYAEGYEGDDKFNVDKFMDFVFPGANAAVMPTGVSLDQTTASLAATQTLQLHATVFPDNATDKTIDWSCEDTSKATVDNTGKVTGVAKGNTVLHAKSHADPTKEAICNLTITDPPTQG